jgi:uncharacterized protein YggE
LPEPLNPKEVKVENKSEAARARARAKAKAKAEKLAKWTGLRM